MFDAAALIARFSDDAPERLVDLRIEFGKSSVDSALDTARESLERRGLLRCSPLRFTQLFENGAECIASFADDLLNPTCELLIERNRSLLNRGRRGGGCILDVLTFSLDGAAERALVNLCALLKRFRALIEFLQLLLRDVAERATSSCDFLCESGARTRELLLQRGACTTEFLLDAVADLGNLLRQRAARGRHDLLELEFVGLSGSCKPLLDGVDSIDDCARETAAFRRGGSLDVFARLVGSVLHSLDELRNGFLEPPARPGADVFEFGPARFG